MLDLNEQPKVPRYELKVGDETKSFDAMVLGYALRDIAEVEAPESVQAKVNEVFGLEVDAFTAGLILKDFFEFADKELREPVKKVFGRELFSTTTTEPASPNSKS